MYFNFKASELSDKTRVLPMMLQHWWKTLQGGCLETSELRCLDTFASASTGRSLLMS